jgi:hypothetical protein
MTAKLTIEDLHQTLCDDRHLGYGYACCTDIESTSKRLRLDKSIVAVANELGLDYETLFHWSNSKNGRYLADGILGCNESPSRENVRHYLNPTAVELSLEGVEVLS